MVHLSSKSKQAIVQKVLPGDNSLFRVGRLMGAMAVSFAWSYKIGDYIDVESPIKVKSHGRRLQSVFKTGFKFLINYNHINFNFL